jgi:hypothetical protein
MSLSRIIERRDAIVASSEPLFTKLSRIDDLVRATAVLALLSSDTRIRRVFDELLDLYIALSADIVASPPAGTSTVAYVNRQAVVRDRARRSPRTRTRMVPAHLLSV